MVGVIRMVWSCIGANDRWFRRDGQGLEVAYVGGRMDVFRSTGSPVDSHA